MLAARQLILVVEDDRAIADPLLYALRTDGFATEWVTTGHDAHNRVQGGGIHLVLLDLGLPDVFGFDLLRELRRIADIPVIIATARDDTTDRIAGLEMGADDYVTKPFSPREVTARVRAVLRRCGERVNAHPEPPPEGKRWQHDPDRKWIAYKGERLALTRYEYRLLACLLQQPGRVFSRDQLMEQAWEDPGASLDRTIDAHIKTLRAKLKQIDAGADEILTHRGMGYALRENQP